MTPWFKALIYTSKLSRHTSIEPSTFPCVIVLSTVFFDEYAWVDGTLCFFMTSSKVIKDFDSLIMANILHYRMSLPEYEMIRNMYQKNSNPNQMQLV